MSIAQPSIAVACENAIIIYKFFKPYFRFLLPNIEMIKEELDAWNRYYSPEDAQNLLATLANLKNNGLSLSSRSTEILSAPPDQLIQIINEYKQVKYFINRLNKIFTKKLFLLDKFSIYS